MLPSKPPSMVRIFHDPEEMFREVKEHIANRMKAYKLTPQKLKKFGVMSIEWTTSKDPALSQYTQGVLYGLCTYQGVLYIVVNNIARSIHQSDSRSKEGAAEDVSPFGVLMHEVGHAVHFKLEKKEGMSRMEFSQKWRELIKGDRPVSRYAYTSPTEDFAETFRMFFLNKSQLTDVRISAMQYFLDRL